MKFLYEPTNILIMKLCVLKYNIFELLPFKKADKFWSLFLYVFEIFKMKFIRCLRIRG